MNNFANNSTPDSPQKKYTYKGGEEVKFISQFTTENHIVEAGVIVRVTGCQYSEYVNVKTRRNAKIRRVPVTSIARTATKPTTSQATVTSPTKKINKYYKPRFRSPEEECFWLNATKEAKQGKVLNIVNKALTGDLYFTRYEEYQQWVKQARLATGL